MALGPAQGIFDQLAHRAQVVVLARNRIAVRGLQPVVRRDRQPDTVRSTVADLGKVNGFPALPDANNPPELRPIGLAELRKDHDCQLLWVGHLPDTMLWPRVLLALG